MGKGIVKLGEGKWAVKDGNLLAAKETNGRFKNTEFTVSRGTRASYVGRDGLIKESNLQDVNLVNNGDFSELGSELVTNGTFDADSDWIKGTGWSIANGKASCNGSSTNLNQNGVLVVGKDYKITITVTDYVSGTVEVSAGAAPRGAMSANGTYTFYQNATPTTNFYIVAQSFDGSIDNVSVKEVDPNDYWILGTGWSIEDGKASCDGSQTTPTFLRQDNVSDIGVKLKVVFDITVTSGTAYLSFSNGGGVVPYTTSGTYEEYGTMTINNSLYIRGQSDFVGSIDNISVQEVKTDTPRIDFTDNTDGHLLLEPQSTNLLTYSEDFSNSYWNPNGVSVESNVATSPDGTTNASKITITDVTPYLGNLNISLIVGNTYTLSCFVKKGTNRWVRLASVSSGSTGAWFDLDNGVVGTVNSTSATIEDYGNGWYRITNTLTAVSGSNDVFLGLSVVDGSVSGADVIGNDVFVWGFQVEALSYPTSYIPTNGSTVTRDADTCTDAGEAIDFNSEEGVLYAEIAALADDATNRCIALSDGTSDDRVTMLFGTSSNRIRAIIKSNGSTSFDKEYTVTSTLDYHKVAIKYKANDFALWIDGVERFTDTSGSAPIGLNQLKFDVGSNALPFYGKCKAIRVYKEALSDTDLQNLTS